MALVPTSELAFAEKETFQFAERTATLTTSEIAVVQNSNAFLSTQPLVLDLELDLQLLEVKELLVEILTQDVEITGQMDALMILSALPNPTETENIVLARTTLVHGFTPSTSKDAFLTAWLSLLSLQLISVLLTNLSDANAVKDILALMPLL
jgi:hypothetical protein